MKQSRRYDNKSWVIRHGQWIRSTERNASAREGKRATAKVVKEDQGEGQGIVSFDTGICISNNEFKCSLNYDNNCSCASWGDNTVDSEDDDCNSHGIHIVADTIGDLE